MVAHGKALRADDHIDCCLAVAIHQVLAEYGTVIFTQAGAEYRKCVASVPFQRVHHRVHEFEILADPVGAVEQQRGGRLAIIAVQLAVLVEGHGVQPAGTIHAILRERHRWLVAVVAAERLVAKETQQIGDVGNTAMVQIFKGRLRDDGRRGGAALEHRIADGLAGAGNQRNTQPPALRFQCGEVLAQSFVAAKQPRKHETRAG